MKLQRTAVDWRKIILNPIHSWDQKLTFLHGKTHLQKWKAGYKDLDCWWQSWQYIKWKFSGKLSYKVAYPSQHFQLLLASFTRDCSLLFCQTFSHALSLTWTTTWKMKWVLTVNQSTKPFFFLMSPQPSMQSVQTIGSPINSKNIKWE